MYQTALDSERAIFSGESTDKLSALGPKSPCGEPHHEVERPQEMRAMAAKGSRAGLYEARENMLAALDRKFKNMPEWQAFRAIDDAVFAMNSAVRSAEWSDRPSAESNHEAKLKKPRRAKRPQVGGPSYGDLGVAAIEAAARPVPTGDMVTFIAARKNLNPDPKRARVNVQSALSHDERIKSIKWKGGTAWWHADRDPPKEGGELLWNTAQAERH
jgi:hypothetical protein